MAFYLTETTTKNKQRERQTDFIMPVEEKLKDAATNVKKKRKSFVFCL